MGYSAIGKSEIGKNLVNININELSLLTPIGTTGSNGRITNLAENTYINSFANSNYWQTQGVKSLSYQNDSLTLELRSAFYGIGFVVRCKPSTTYRFSYNVDYAIPTYRIACYDNEGNFVKMDNEKMTTPENGYWLIVVVTSQFRDIEMTFSNIQLELGNEPTNYEPYKKEAIQYSPMNGNNEREAN